MDNLQKDWQNANVSLNANSYDSIINGKRKTALDRLADRYKRFSMVGISLILLSVSWCFNEHIFPGNTQFRIIIAVGFALYALAASVMDRWLYLGIRSISVATMPVTEVIRKALFYRKRHLQFIAILLPWVIALIASIAWKDSNIYFRMGILFGVITGFAVGINQLMNFLADYRTITSED